MNNSIDQQFVEFVVKSLVGNPDAVHIDRTIDEKGVLLELTVDPEDLGRVIGKRGATAQSLRTLLRALGTKNEARYNLKIIDNGPQDIKHEQNQASAVPSDAQVTDDVAPVGSAHDTDADEPATEKPAHEPSLDNRTTGDQADEDDRLARARRELAEFDDLDV